MAQCSVTWITVYCTLLRLHCTADCGGRHEPHGGRRDGASVAGHHERRRGVLEGLARCVVPVCAMGPIDFCIGTRVMAGPLSQSVILPHLQARPCTRPLSKAFDMKMVGTVQTFTNARSTIGVMHMADPVFNGHPISMLFAGPPARKEEAARVRCFGYGLLIEVRVTGAADCC